MGLQSPPNLRSPYLSSFNPGWLPTGAITQNFARSAGDQNIAALTTARLSLTGGMVLPHGVPVTSISVRAGATDLGGASNQWFCLVAQDLTVLRKTVDDGATAWAGRTTKTLALSSTYTPPSDLPVYIGIVVVATTVPTLAGVTHSNSAGYQSVTPRMASVAVTTPATLTDPASLVTVDSLGASATQPWAYVS